MSDKLTVNKFQETADKMIDTLREYGLIPSKLIVADRYKEELLRELQEVMEIKPPFTYKGVLVEFQSLPKEISMDLLTAGHWEFP